MYTLEDLKGLLYEETYNILDEAEGGGKKYDLIKDEVEQVITTHTNYTDTELSSGDYDQIKDQIRRPFAWILEYFALKFVVSVPEERMKIITMNYKEALEMLSTFPRFYDADTPEGGDDSSSTFDIPTVGW